MVKISKILLNSIPVLVMIGLIPFVGNDYLLAGLCVLIIFLAFIIKKEKDEGTIFTTGLILMTFFEYLFIFAGSEIFIRNTLFGVMPVWLPLIWGYGFVAISRAVEILKK